MSVKEFKIICQMQYFKGNNFISITTLVLLFDKNCSGEEISSSLNSAKFGDRLWSLMVCAFKRKFFRNQMHSFAGLWNSLQTRPVRLQNDQKLK